MSMYPNIYAEITGYQEKTTFWDDFSIADEMFGPSAVQETFDRAFEDWKDNCEYLTELVLVLNWKLWQQYERKNKELYELYNKLWEQADKYACDNLKGADLDYFYTTTD